jgi:hypothetical protein
MRFRFFYFILFAAMGTVVSGCDLSNPAETVPTYVYVDSFRVDATPAVNTGSLSHEIKSVWVYYNNEGVGAFDLPANIPIITKGPGTVQLVPAVSFSGSTTVMQYPFYEPDTFTIPYTPGQATKVTGKTRYRTNAKFILRDFELGGNPFVKINSEKAEDTGMVVVTDKDKVFEGSRAGYIYLSRSLGHPSSELISQGDEIPYTTSDVYVELNYKCDVAFEVGIQTIAANGDLVNRYLYGFYPSEGLWRKAYIGGLKEFMTEYKGRLYNIMIRTNLPEGQATGSVSLDNIKVVSF